MMAGVRAKPMLEATFAKRQRRISELDAKGATEEGSVIVAMPVNDVDEVEEDDAVSTPEVESRQAVSGKDGASAKAQPTIDPHLVEYFKLIDEQELLVEEADDDDK